MPSTPAAKTLRILRTARDLIARPHGWTKGQYKTTKKNGVEAYCALGAIDAAARRLHLSLWVDADDARRALYPFVDWRDIAGFNDDKETKKADVIALFDRAIKELEGKK